MGARRPEAVEAAQLAAVRHLHKPHKMPFDASSPAKYDVDATTDVCRHCSLLKGVPVVWPCETAAAAYQEPEPRLVALGDHEGEDEWTY